MTAEPDTATEAKVPMVQRNLRVPLDLWNTAGEKASQEDPPRGISDLVRDLLGDYVAGASS